MEELLQELDELISKAKEEMDGLEVGSEEWKSASEAYYNLIKARSDVLKMETGKETTMSKIWEAIQAVGPWVGPILLGIGKFYEVWARRRTNQEAMYVEEVAAKYIPKTPWNNR